MNERREHLRWQIDRGAEVAFENGVKAIPCTVEDISQGGMRLSLRRDLFDDVFSNFKLALAEDFELRIEAQVVWRQSGYESSTYGLAFHPGSMFVKESIEGYIRKNFPELLVRHLWKDLNA
ncbi:MAG: PilZ domain-containing protein [Candidatus Omnitrophica bacterium]|nr:PilZ domain-containing protein [Candidatus Omnitrophota bacterium]